MLTVVGAVGFTGCSSGGDTSATSTTPASPPAVAESPGASAAVVAERLKTIDQAAKGAAQVAGIDKAKAASLDGQIEPMWKTIEDTVKANDQDTYLALEDGFAMLEKATDEGDAAAAAKSSAAISSSVQTYLAKYSG